MKRRTVLQLTPAIAGLAPGFAHAAACPPVWLSVAGGSSTSTSCPSGAPAWFNALPEKTWGTVAASGTIQAVLPSPSPGGTPQGITSAWSGAVLDTKRQELQIPAQGGHSDYYGNEVYALALNTATPRWARLTNPRYDWGPGSTMDDGSPRATHGRCFMAYAANTDRTLMTAMSGFAPLGSSSNNGFAFDRNTNTWAPRAHHLIDEGFESGGAEYDPVTGYVWIIGTQSFVSVSRYDPRTDSHTAFSTYLNQGYAGTTALAPSRRAMLYLNGSVVNSDGTFRWMDLDNPNAGWRLPAAVSGTPIRTSGPGFRWHARSGAFIGWDGGVNLYKLTPPADLVNGTWAWSSITPASGNSTTPSARQPAGTYTRFNLIDNFAGSGRDLLVLVNAIDQPTYVYKLPIGGV
jgi:hypothetical protein